MDFELRITADTRAQRVELELKDGHGNHRGYHEADLKALPESRIQALFDLRHFLKLYVEPAQQADAVADIGVCIAKELLGDEIFDQLWAPRNARTLRLHLSGAGEADNPLAAALARVPWEIARPDPFEQTLAEKGLQLRIVTDMLPPDSEPLAILPHEPLRVLFVFAEARDSTPLGVLQERRALEALFRKDIQPKRQVEAHFLSHGVTRARLAEQIRDNGGYHVLHWSGHGHVNQLELAQPGGAPDNISGAELLELFQAAGGYLPRLVFLSSCHSGSLARVADWTAFLNLAREGEDAVTAEENAAVPQGWDNLRRLAGFTGTAHALLRGGVPTVVAMRYAVGDLYAQALGRAFYTALLADTRPKPPAEALNQARNQLLDGRSHDAARFMASDPANPLLYGEGGAAFNPPQGRSPALAVQRKCLPDLPELRLTSHAHFVGRSWQLAELGAEFIGSRAGATVKAVAAIVGLGGMGKTALTAQALDLWRERFDWCLLHQAKPNALGFEATLQKIDQNLREVQGVYYQHVLHYPADAIYRAASENLTGPARLRRLTENLLRAMRDEALLLVLDNFETNLKPHPEAESTLYACQDPAWQECLTLLARELADSPSRVLITCRRPLQALAKHGLDLHLGPLPPKEAALYLRFHPELSRLAFSSVKAEKELALDILNASRFHPLLMDRLGRLASDPALLPQLSRALTALKTTGRFGELSELLVAEKGGNETAYLEDALALSVDGLIADCPREARSVLWMIALANEAVEPWLLEGVWSVEDGPETAQLRQMKQLLDVLAQLPEELRAQAPELPPELRALLEKLPPEAAKRPNMTPLLARLLALGLAEGGKEIGYACHETVRERILPWMEAHAEDLGGLTADAVRLAYAERLEAAFNALQHKDMASALAAGGRALVYCVEAKAWDRLGSFAGSIVTGASDPRFLEALLPPLREAAEAAPEGRPRWSCLTYLADALESSGHPENSLEFYEQAAAEAEVAAKSGSDGTRQAWADLAWISGNWANALYYMGQNEAAKGKHLESALAERNAGKPTINAIGSELEALRIDIQQGKWREALPEVEAKLEQVAGWWQRHLQGEKLAEAPEAELLARVYISALNIAMQADYARKDWNSALERVEAMLDTKQKLGRPDEDIAGTRFNRANVLVELPGRMAEARQELEACLGLFEHHPAHKAKCYSSLADLFDEHGDVAQAILQQRRALALCDTLPDPSDRAISHNNLANYLEKRGEAGDFAASARHQLAALCYFLAAGYGQHLQTSLSNYTVRFHNARQEGQELFIPRLAELLADAEFAPLEHWLAGRQVDAAELQAAIDDFLAQARLAAA